MGIQRPELSLVRSLGMTLLRTDTQGSVAVTLRAGSIGAVTQRAAEIARAPLAINAEAGSSGSVLEICGSRRQPTSALRHGRRPLAVSSPVGTPAKRSVSWVLSGQLHFHTWAPSVRRRPRTADARLSAWSLDGDHHHVVVAAGDHLALNRRPPGFGR